MDSESAPLPQREARVFLLGLAMLLASCASRLETYLLRRPLHVDPDERTFVRAPDVRLSGLYWDGADQMLFGPLARLWAVDPSGEAVNADALDEVPNSSWWTNRIGMESVTPEQAREGPCAGIPALDEDAGPWEVFKAQPNAATPGFFISAPDGRKYVFKTDGSLESQRPTAADAIGSRLYWLVGYNAPCHRVVFVRRSIFTIKKGARSEDAWGAKIPMTEHDIDDVLANGVRTADDRYRGSVSLLIEREILGPFRYEGTRDDPNDGVPHEDLRELRASRVIASLLYHADAREQDTPNTYDPDTSQPRYDHPAMLRRTERDAAWMARIIARIGNAHLTAIVDAARFGDAFLEREALRLLRGRQRRLLARFLSRLSPLTRPSVRLWSERGASLCLEDAAVIARIVDGCSRRYAARAWVATEPRARVLSIDAAGGSVCAKLPSVWGASSARPRYAVVDVVAVEETEPLPPARVHLYALGDADYRVVGLERPDEDAGPP